MIIILPNNSDHRTLQFFQSEAMARLEDISIEGNIFEEALTALEERRTVNEAHVLNMPSFKIDTNIDVEKHLRMVIAFCYTVSSVRPCVLHFLK